MLDTIETFDTPPQLVQKGFPRSLGKAFKDDKEMSASSDLSREIKDALWHSEYLIVVCSLDTPPSKWVRAEIKLFQHWACGEKILALLVESDPESSYPPELLRWEMVGEGPDATMEFKEPGGASVVEVQAQIEAELKSLVRDRFACRILGCEFAELRGRQEERLRRETTVAYFHTFVRRRGVSEGVGELDEATVARRERSYRLEMRGGRVRRIALVDSHGTLRTMTTAFRCGTSATGPTGASTLLITATGSAW